MTTLLRKGPWLTAGFVLLAVSLGSRPELELDRAAVLDGQFWRIVSGHFVHYGHAHAVGDILGFAGWATMIEAVSRRLLLTVTALSIASVGLGVLFFCPEVQHYAGLSGLDVALATAILCVAMASPRFRKLPGARVLLAIVAAGHVVKMAYELVFGVAILAPDLGQDVRLLPAAHVFGAVAGALGWYAVHSDAKSTIPRGSLARHDCVDPPALVLERRHD